MLCETASSHKIGEHEGQRGGVRCPGDSCAGAEADRSIVFTPPKPKLETRARARKLTLSKWVRAELLEPREGGGGAADEVLLGEVLALRTILINLRFSLGSGKPVTL